MSSPFECPRSHARLARSAYPSLGIALLSLVLGTGAECTPTEPGCRHRADCPGEMRSTRSCINFCVPMWPGPDEDRDGLCALDECDEALLAEPDIWRCPNGFECSADEATRDPSRIGRCRATTAEVLSECDPMGERGCSSGTVCMPLPQCADRFAGAPDRWVARGARGMCVMPAREGELCDSTMWAGEPGCRACEWGTFCRDTSSGPRCLRPCVQADDPTRADPSQCPCDVAAACQPWREIAPEGAGAFDVQPGEPEHYCPAPCVTNGALCERAACCDRDAKCNLTEDPATGLRDLRCCRTIGSECASDDDCCGGEAECIGGQCVRCAGEGEPDSGNAGCCPGYVGVEGVCRSCATSVEGRELYRRYGSCDGSFVQLLDVQGASDTVAVPARGTTSAGAAELPRTRSGVQRVRYELGPNHRAFVLEGDLTAPWEPVPCAHPPEYFPQAGGECTAGVPYPGGGSTVGHQFVFLPEVTRDGAIEYPISTLGAWSSVRVYDSGLCSTFISWDSLAHAAIAGINRGLVNVPFSSALRLDSNRFTPILASGSGSFGRGAEQDQLNVFVEYTAVEGAGGCGSPTRVRFHTGLRLRRQPAAILTEEGARLERTRVMEDWLPCFSEPLLGPGERAIDCLEQCHTFARDTFFCTQRYTRVRADGSMQSFSNATHYPGLVRYATDAFDFVPEPAYIDGGAVDCGLAWVSPVLLGRARGAIDRVFPSLLAEYAGVLTVRAERVGIPFEALVDCSDRDGDGNLVPNDGICADTSSALFGGRRHRCVGYDAMGVRAGHGATQYRCADLRIEVRRINLRPDGIELVFADDESDPQLPLVLAGQAESCRGDRPGVPPDPPSRPPLLPRALQSSEGLQSPTGAVARTICNTGSARRRDDGVVEGCDGICGDMGVQCTGIIHDQFRPRLARQGGLQCFVFEHGRRRSPRSQCCHSTPPPAVPGQERWVLCPWREDDGGERLLNIGASPSPDDFFLCRNLDNDALSCGACGVRCAAGQRCVGGTCL